MKRWILILLAVLGAGGLLWFASDKIRASKTGDGGPKPDFMAGSQVWIEGNSSLRRYSMDMGMISAKSDLNRVLKVDALLTLILHRKDRLLVVTLPVKSLTSGDI